MIPKQCLLIGTAQYKECATCPLCPEGKEKPPKWSYWEWCKEWLEANKECTR